MNAAANRVSFFINKVVKLEIKSIQMYMLVMNFAIHDFAAKQLYSTIDGII